jgi:hypothetical protein
MQMQRLPAARGVRWLSDGFALYRRNPPLLTMLTLGFLMIVAAFSLLQSIGQFLLPLVLPTMTALVANGYRAVDQIKTGRVALEREALLVGLVEHRLPLWRLGILHLLGMLIVLGIDLLFGNVDVAPPPAGTAGDTALLLHMLRLTALASPLLLAFWFAPLLTAWEGVPAAKSLFFSFVAAWRNWRAFLSYGFAVMVVGVLLPSFMIIVATLISPRIGAVVSLIVQGMLLLTFAPVLMATVYVSYRDVFMPPENDA